MKDKDNKEKNTIEDKNDLNLEYLKECINKDIIDKYGKKYNEHYGDINAFLLSKGEKVRKLTVYINKINNKNQEYIKKLFLKENG